MRKEVRLYNILFPLWLLIWIPSWLWLFLIPGNYAVDTLVTSLAMKHEGVPEYKKKAFQHSWKICIAGFLSDFVGAGLLLAICMADDGARPAFFRELVRGITWSPFSFFPSFLVIVLAVLISASCIYFLDRWILSMDSTLTKEQAKRTAFWLAVFTAPYLFLFPSALLYR